MREEIIDIVSMVIVLTILVVISVLVFDEHPTYFEIMIVIYLLDIKNEIGKRG